VAVGVADGEVEAEDNPWGCPFFVCDGTVITSWQATALPPFVVASKPSMEYARLCMSMRLGSARYSA
jgi:hypothetical protein